MRIHTPLLTICVLAVGLASCSGDAWTFKSKDKDSSATANSKDDDTKSKKDGAYTYDNPGFLRDASAMTAAITALKAKPQFRGKDIAVFQNASVFDDGRIILTLQDPARPENVDEWTYTAGAWKTPEPVQLSGDGDMAENVTPLSQIGFEKLAAMMATADEKARGIEGGKTATHASFLYSPTIGQREWTISVEGARAKYHCDFGADGTFKDFKKY